MNKVASIIFEDSSIVVINKCAGIVVNRSNTTKNVTLQDWIEEKYPSLFTKCEQNDESDFFSRSGIVHRLDKETSGVILAAKSPDSFLNLQQQFKARTVEKTYTALCHGKVVPAQSVIRAPIGRLPWNRMKFGVTASGRDAESMYTVSSYYRWRDTKNKETLSLVEVLPKTGRTHQIRVHMKYIGYPLFADALYCGRKTYRKDKKLLDRHFLHASRIVFEHPETRERVEFSSPLPSELSKIVSLLQ